MNTFAEQFENIWRMNKREGHLLVDEELADQVWEAWDEEEIGYQVAWIAWILLAQGPLAARKPPLD